MDKNRKRSVEKSAIALYLLMISLIVASYSNTLYSPFVLDDKASFIDVPQVYIKDFSFESLAQLTKTRLGPERVIPLLTFAIDHHLHDGSIVQYHLTNILIHILTANALLLFLFNLFKLEILKNKLHFFAPATFSLVVAMLWALHPVQTNAVTYIVQRMASLCAFFYLTSLGLYVRARLSTKSLPKALNFLGSTLAAIAAFLSKENSATLPLAIFLIEFLFISPDSIKAFFKKISWKQWLAICSIVMICLPLLSAPMEQLIQGYDRRHFTLTERLYTEFRVMAHYLSLLVFPLPSRLTFDYDFSVSTSLIAPPTTILSLLGHAALLITAVRYHRRQPLLSFGIFWFYLNLAIESTVPALELAFEHRLYLPSVGFFILVTLFIDHSSRFIRQSEPETKKAIFAFVVLLSASLSILTTIRNNVWRDEVSFYRDSYLKSPNKPRALVNYATSLGRHGEYDKAIELAQRAIDIGRVNYESYVDAANTILVCLEQQGEIERAASEADRLIQNMDRQINAVNYHYLMANIGTIYLEQERYQDALKAYLRGFEYQSEFLDQTDLLYHSILSLFDKAKKDEKALKKLEWDGSDDAALIRVANLARSLRHYERAQKFLEIAAGSKYENEEAEKLLVKIEKEISQNKKYKEDSNIKNSKNYQHNAPYRSLIFLSDFLANYYPPLSGKPALWLLYGAKQTAPNDPFVDVRIAKWFLEHNQPQRSIDLLKKIIIDAPDFIPALEVALPAYLAIDKPEKAAIIAQYILSHYPGHPKWQYFEKIASYEADGRDGQSEEIL